MWYLLIAVGTFLEGEMVMIAAAVGVYNNHLSMSWVVAAALVGSFSGDWCWFELGRRKGEGWLENRPKWKPRLQGVSRFLQKHPIFSIFLLRFQIAMRMAGNFTLGYGELGRVRYLALTFAACFLWAWTIAQLCFWFIGFLALMRAQLTGT